jgi:hypothetical protein
MLDGGRVLFKRSMVHFAPAHAEVLALYDPRTDRESTVYPLGTRNERGIEPVAHRADEWIDRSFTEIKKVNAPATVAFAVLTQRVRFNARNGGDPVGPQERFRVQCDLSATPPSCTRR